MLALAALPTATAGAASQSGDASTARAGALVASDFPDGFEATPGKGATAELRWLVNVAAAATAALALCWYAWWLVPIVAVPALVNRFLRQREAFARHQALAFELERSELERQALDARLHLLQGQVAPHFLFNTLANVQALVDAQSPQASTLLRSLIDYLRASVPLLHETAATLAQELQLVRAYLDLMHMRMPDRLRFTLHVEESALALRCPPTTRNA